MQVDEPTMSMLFTSNNSPFFGREGTLVTSRQLRDTALQGDRKEPRHEGRGDRLGRYVHGIWQGHTSPFNTH
ncbi:MAG: hypothetical protein MZV63_68020 [Marinilabiliales bacterium]|nr:hypothetical protein [Marinilabiliales bacterium]